MSPGYKTLFVMDCWNASCSTERKPSPVMVLLHLNRGIEEIAEHLRLKTLRRLVRFVDFPILNQQGMGEAGSNLLDMMGHIE